eukprot:3254810-Rhodomonas_salina.1
MIAQLGAFYGGEVQAEVPQNTRVLVPGYPGTRAHVYPGTWGSAYPGTGPEYPGTRGRNSYPA